MTLPVGDHTNTPQVSATSHHAQVTWEKKGHFFEKSIMRRRNCGLAPVRQPTTVKLDEVCDLAGVQVDANCVIDLNEGVRVADGAGVVGHQVGDSFGANDDLLDFAQLVLKRRRTSTEQSEE